MTDAAPLISTTELAARLGDPSLKLIDASWHLDGRDGRPDFETARLPGAVFFDLEASSDQGSDLPHMLPAPDFFAARMGALGITADHSIVVYDTVGIRSSARVWWMLRAMGARDVRVLDGGLPKWLAEGRMTESGPGAPAATVTFTPNARPDLLADLDDVRVALKAGDQVLDARAADRFAGRAPEPRAGLRSGHMPAALNLPFPDILNHDGTMKRGEALAQAYRSAGIDLDRPMVTTCGSGVTAAILSLGLAVLGRSSRLYDGSWAEWGGRADTEVVSAPPA
ncbi:MAG: sulfurtransferase [Brevundimonas sp.]|nr:sulfurtransferase [Brevundimonas sp.]MDZ4061929.1 sulfurtransferase [Brevundimonas sp.]